MSQTERVEAYIEPDLKQAAEAVFAKLGVSASEAIRLLYQQVKLQQGFPFEVQIPNAETLAAIAEVDEHPERLKRYNSLDEMFEAWDTDAEAC